jgi:hypothetical protein
MLQPTPSTLRQGLNTLRTRTLTGFVELIQASDLANDEDFHTMMHAGLRQYQVMEEKEFARLMCYSIRTVNRWILGGSQPSGLIRQASRDRFIAAAQAEIARLQAG